MSPARSTGDQQGISLIVTLVVTAGVGIVMGSVLHLTASRASFSRRASQYDQSVAAAVAATQKVHARIARDFQRSGEGEVYNNLSNYRNLVPLRGEILAALQTLGLGGSPDTPWKEQQFLDAAGQINQSSVQKISEWSFRDLRTRFTGLRGYAADYTVVSTTRKLNSGYDIVSAVKQEIQVASIPIFQYQLFYVPDMEIHPSGVGLSFNGRVHCNGNLYCKPEGTVTFQSHVTAARKYINGRHPDDPVEPKSGSVLFRGERTARVNSLNIPTQTANTATNLRALIEAPPLGELATSPLGQQRFYNKADLIVVISNSTILAHSGTYNGMLVRVPWIESRGIVTTGKKVFYDKRENKEQSTSEVDLAAFLANFTDLTALLGRPPKILWVTDLRAPTWSSLYGIRLINGRTLPDTGLTIATPNSLYVHGHFNVPLANLGTTNTAGARPACIAADAVTILSGAWLDGNGPKSLAYRIADDTTVNAAVITGIVPTGGGNYSGGVENALRTLENWSGKTLTFNGAIAVLYYGTRANAPWGGPDVYSPPTRKYSYDWNLRQASTMPPGTPEVRTILHGDWTIVQRPSTL